MKSGKIDTIETHRAQSAAPGFNRHTKLTSIMTADCGNLYLFYAIICALNIFVNASCLAQQRELPVTADAERKITDRATGHILTNTNVWSPDGRWIVYDTRSDPAGEKFDGQTIEIVNVETGEVREVYRARNGANCGAATFSPKGNQVIFILGPEHPSDEWRYGPWHRQGVIVDIDPPHRATALDARDLTKPFTPGALRGGTHLHVFDAEAELVSFTYEDHLLASLNNELDGPDHDYNQRNVGVSLLRRPVRVSSDHSRNHDGSAFSVLVTQTKNTPRPGSDEISRACEEAWIGQRGYLRKDGTRQPRALAFQGSVATRNGTTIAEVFVVDLPDDVTTPDVAPLEGTATTRPFPPRGTQQRRLTNTEDRRFPGLQGPRHWLHSSPDGAAIAFLMRDDDGVVQISLISPNGGEPRQLTHNHFDVASAFSWSPDGQWISYVADGSVFVTQTSSGATTRLTPRTADAAAPRPEACVFSPDGNRIAYVRQVTDENGTWNQIFVVSK
jgi:dipeptidyl aminopeptidase/acylaminoacyl peptidase